MIGGGGGRGPGQRTGHLIGYFGLEASEFLYSFFLSFYKFRILVEWPS